MLLAGNTIVSAPRPRVHPATAISLLAEVMTQPRVHDPRTLIVAANVGAIPSASIRRCQPASASIDAVRPALSAGAGLGVGGNIRQSAAADQPAEIGLGACWPPVATRCGVCDREERVHVIGQTQAPLRYAADGLVQLTFNKSLTVLCHG